MPKIRKPNFAYIRSHLTQHQHPGIYRCHDQGYSDFCTHKRYIGTDLVYDKKNTVCNSVRNECQRKVFLFGLPMKNTNNILIFLRFIANSAGNVSRNYVMCSLQHLYLNTPKVTICIYENTVFGFFSIKIDRIQSDWQQLLLWWSDFQHKFSCVHVSWFTVYPKKYAHGFCFAVLCCGYTLTDFPISIRLTSLALWQSNDCPSASKATLMNMDKYFMWIHYERLHNHKKAKHNKIVCIFRGIYCTHYAMSWGSSSGNDTTQSK